MEAELPPDVTESLAELKDCVKEIETHLSPLLNLQAATGTALTAPLTKSLTAGKANAAGSQTLRELVEELSPLEGSKLYAGMAYSLYTLFFSTYEQSLI